MSSNRVKSKKTSVKSVELKVIFLDFMESMKKSRKFFGKNKKGLNLGWKF